MAGSGTLTEFTDRLPERGATRVVVEVWVENRHREKTAVGHATGLM